MRRNDFNKIRKAMERALDTDRYEHTLGVSYTAAALAMCHGGDVRKAQLAGMLHDCAKGLTDEKRLSICDKHNISVTEIERRNPYLLHAKVGSFLAMEEYKVTDSDIIHAILNHTTGRPGMSLLEKIIFVADYIEPERKHAPNLREIRGQAFKDLDGALIRILEDTLEYLKSTGGEIDPMTERTWAYYSQRPMEER